MKKHSIETIETQLSKMDVIGQIKEITLEERFWNINVNGKYLCHGNFEGNSISFNLLQIGKISWLSPRITVQISEKEQGCTVQLFSQKTWKGICMLITWICFWMITTQINLLSITLHLMICFLGIYSGVIHEKELQNRAVDILKKEVFNPNFAHRF